MTSGTEARSPLADARLAGILYLVIILCAGFSEGYVRSGLVVPGDAAATADNIRASEWLFRVGFATDLVAFLSDVALAVVFYVLLKPVSTTLSLLAASFRLAQATILGINMLHHFAPLLLLSGAGYLGAFDPAQLDALAMLSLEGHKYGYLIGQMFFGLHCGLLGFLLFKSGYFPRVLGVLLVTAGLGYLGDGLTFFLLPDQAARVSPVYLTPVVVAELSLCLWLLVRGGSVTRVVREAVA
jgi:hypothetical protein